MSTHLYVILVKFDICFKNLIMCSCNKKIFDVSLIENLIEFVFFRRYYLLATRIFLETLHKISLIVYFHLFFSQARDCTEKIHRPYSKTPPDDWNRMEKSWNSAVTWLGALFMSCSRYDTLFEPAILKLVLIYDFFFNLILTESFAIEFILNHDIHQFNWLQMSKESVGVSKNCYSAAGMKLFGGRDKNLVVGGSLLGFFSWWGGWTNFWLMGEDPNREDADQCDCYKEYLFVNTFNWKHGFIFLIL